MEQKENKVAKFGRIVWLYLKYQLITKGLLLLVVFPASKWMLKTLLESTGRTSISSGDYLSFLLSIQGAALLLIAFALLALLIGTDVNAFIIVSALIREGRIKLTARQLLVVGLKSVKNFLNPAGVALMTYVALIVPLVGIGITIGPMESFKIPNFITDVIFKNPLYLSLYAGLMIVLTVISFIHTFAFHYILISNQSITDGMKNARKLMVKHWKSFLVDFVGVVLLWLIGSIVVVIGVAMLFVIQSSGTIGDVLVSRAIMIFGLLFVVQVVAFLTFMTIPLLMDRLTQLFYCYNAKDGHPVKLKMQVIASELGDEAYNKVKLRTKAFLTMATLGLLVVNAFVAIVSATSFNELFRPTRNIDIVAHRGGGDLAAENSLASLEEAIKANVAWSEIDVQRTQDGYYVINHDGDFKRVAGDPRKSIEMTLDEAKQLMIKDLFDSSRPSQPVATIEEFLDQAKGRIGLFIELKGSTADEKMADDLITMIKERDMIEETALLSLDYPLIQYVEKVAPEIQTGYLYYFAVGEMVTMQGDILIMEEREATPAKIQEIHAAGKKAIVWTVNTEESIEQFVNSEVDGIITDYVLRVQEGVETRNNRTDYEVVVDALFN